MYLRYFHNILRFTIRLFLVFKPNEIVIQTMCSNDADVDIRGFYTTRIPSESLEEYEFECNIPEVNVIVTSSLMRSTSKVAGGCKNINVVPSGFLLINEMTERLVEVSFDLYKNSRRKRKVVDELDSYDDDDDITSSGTSSKIFGRVVRRPYLHYLFTSRIDYKIHRIGSARSPSEPIGSNFRYSSIVVRNPLLFKSQYGLENRIFIAENGTILFCGCHRFSESDSIIQPYNGIFGTYDADEENCELFDYELPSKIFKHLFKFISQIINKGRDVMINNFEILIRRHESTPPEEPKVAFKVVSINFYTPFKTSEEKQLENNKKREVLKRNFDSRDDWTNVKPHCHALNEHEEGPMVLPEIKMNHRYYSTHAYYKDFEPLRRSEFLWVDNDDVIDKPCRTSRMYDYITAMIEESHLNGKVITQDDIFKKIKKLDPELYKNYLEGEVTPVFKI